MRRHPAVVTDVVQLRADERRTRERRAQCHHVERARRRRVGIAPDLVEDEAAAHRLSCPTGEGEQTKSFLSQSLLADVTALVGGTIHPVTSDPIENGVLVFDVQTASLVSALPQQDVFIA